MSVKKKWSIQSHTPCHIQVFKNSGFSSSNIPGLFTEFRDLLLHSPFLSQERRYDQSRWTIAFLFYENWPSTTSCNIIKFKTLDIFFKS